MKKTHLIRSALLASALCSLVACGGADDVASPGEGGVITIPGGSSGGGSNGGGSNGGGTPGGPAASCPQGFADIGVIANNRACQLPNLIDGNLTLDKIDGLIYAMNGRVQVGQDVGGDGSLAGGQSATLTIDPGVVVYARNAQTFLIVNRGSQLLAEGTATAPIIFTSQANINGTTNDNQRGQWGGVLVLGRAPIADCVGATGGTAQCQLQAEGAGSGDFYGGALAGDSSGRMRYIQIRYTGQGANNSELQGLTLAGVGNGTVVDHIQSHNSDDDGIEIFGGTVNLSHLIITGPDDDGYDLDKGYIGSTQFLIVADDEEGAMDRGFEIDDDLATLDYNATPRTDLRIANFTITRPSASGDGIILRGGPDVVLLNGIVFNGGGSGSCLDIDQAETVQAAGAAADENGPPVFQSVVLSCAGGGIENDSDGIDDAAFFTGANTNASFASTLATVNGGPGNFVNGTGETGVTAVANLTSFSSFFTQVDYIGAVRDANDTWYRSWSCNASYLELGAPQDCASSPV